MPEVRVNGVDLAYIDDGVGTPVVFVHGAWMDLRYWEPQREGVAAHHRFVAYTLRYHGTAPWPDDGKNYSAATHAADLAAFIHQLNAGPVHLVGLSLGGRLATMVALEHPDLLRSLTVLEPPLHDLLDDLPEAQAVRDDWRRGFEALRTKAQAGDGIGAARLFYELANDQGPGALVGEAAVARDDEEPSGPRQGGDDLLDHAVGEILLLARSRVGQVRT